ncbi:39155_t:CDS:1, partial [Gigaspora margarita]
SSNHKLYLANSYYDIYTANSNKEVLIKQESSMGTMIAMEKTIQL